MHSVYIYVSVSIKVKVKLSLCLTKYHAMKTYRWVAVELHAFIDLGTRCRWVVSFTPPPLYSQGKSPWRIAGWECPWAVLDTVVKRKFSSPRRELNPRTPIVQPVVHFEILSQHLFVETEEYHKIFTFVTGISNCEMGLICNMGSIYNFAVSLTLKET